MMTNREILAVALAQSAIDLGCAPDDLLRDENTVVLSRVDPSARKYLKLPFLCSIVHYGRGVVASVSEEYRAIAADYVNRFPAEHLFETPNLHVLNDAAEALGGRVCFLAEYFLPDVTKIAPLDCPFEIRLLTPADFAGLYLPEWSNALCDERRELDVLAAGAYTADGNLIGLAGCSADCDTMWQIGVDVLPDYRRQGVAAALTSRLTFEILDRGKVPFYCAAWSNVRSVRNALKCGYRPAWVELSVKPRETVDSFNRPGKAES